MNQETINKLIDAMKRAVAAARPEQYPVMGSDGGIIMEAPEWLTEAQNVLKEVE